jgi:hypothetical protein
MNLRMIRAEIVKLVERRGLMAWALLLTSGAVTIVFAVLAVRHASDPGKYSPAGGLHSFQDASYFLAMIGTAAAVLVGTMAGAGDLGAGVFRDLVVTGRSRLALFWVRSVGALAVFLPLILLAVAVDALAATTLSGSLAAPSLSMILQTSGWIVLSTCSMLIVAVGVSSLIGSRAPSITVLLAWQLLVSQLLVQVSFLGHVRDALLLAANQHFAPAGILGSRTGYSASSAVIATLVVAAWVGVALAAGAWRTRTIDA